MKISIPLTKTSSGPNLHKIEEKTNITFKSKELLKNAFVHRSYLNENKNYKGPSNERLEFLGDSVLSIVVSRHLFLNLPKSPEGELTQIRAALVRTETLAKLAKDLSLGEYLFLSKGEEESGGRENSSMLANTFEAYIGAVYLDQGLDIVQKYLEKYILSNWKKLSESAVSDNKSKLQEILQRIYHQSPTYSLITSWGPDHARNFEIGVYLGKKLLGSGEGKNKQEAAQSAARSALLKIKSTKITTDA